jgi:GxxExxY protein
MTENEISYQIRGAIYDVYKELGPGLLESVYEEALVFELKERGLDVERQVMVPIIYKGEVLATELRLDIIVEKTVIIELKSVSELMPVHFKQTRTYLRLMKKHLGILVNFNTDNILNDSIHRVVN